MKLCFKYVFSFLMQKVWGFCFTIRFLLLLFPHFSTFTQKTISTKSNLFQKPFILTANSSGNTFLFLASRIKSSRPTDWLFCFLVGQKGFNSKWTPLIRRGQLKQLVFGSSKFFGRQLEGFVFEYFGVILNLLFAYFFLFQ